jgi:thymidylate synthase ThyX
VIVTSAKVIADSLSPSDIRITTFELKFHRFILPEFNTHRMLSRNAASSRAIPVKKMLESVQQDPAYPVWWGKNQPGMKAREELGGEELERAKAAWLAGRDAAVDWATRMVESGLHKQIANRILEPYAWTTVIVTATEWNNFYALRNHPDAQPEFKALTDEMLKAHNASRPQKLDYYQWHIPYLHPQDAGLSLEDRVKCSVARCARVSYLNHDGSDPNVEKDIALHDMLLNDGHMSPFEHQATPAGPLVWYGNFRGWRQYRKTLPNESRQQFEGLQRPQST